MYLQTCVSPSGKFVYGLHKPAFRVTNLREHDSLAALGVLENGNVHDNHVNFPPGDLVEEHSDWIYEISNPLPFRGRTYICKSWADARARDLSLISLPPAPEVSYARYAEDVLAKQAGSLPPSELYKQLPEPLLLALASSSTDPEDLKQLARLSCVFVDDPTSGAPVGLQYRTNNLGHAVPVIHHKALFEVVVNNIHLPDHYKDAMVLRPGVQGGSEIVGECRNNGHNSHIFEYLRRNSYIPWGHFAANMANDAIRYRIEDLTLDDMYGLRHLYYQRMFIRMAELLNIDHSFSRQTITPAALEDLRLRVADALQAASDILPFNSTLWGWNFGFDYAPSHYRLHASHQQIHQQYALLPSSVMAMHDHATPADEPLVSYSCGDLIQDFITDYKKRTGNDFFTIYIQALRNNRRMDHRDQANHSLIIYEDEHVMLFVPKAQTSQWELQLMTMNKVGNVLEADIATRQSLDRAMLFAQKILARLGARMVTSIEFPKRFDAPLDDQRLLYAFLPKLPYAMGAFSEAQLRYINGHYPEDFAAVCLEKFRNIQNNLV